MHLAHFAVRSRRIPLSIRRMPTSLIAARAYAYYTHKEDMHTPPRKGQSSEPKLSLQFALHILVPPHTFTIPNNPDFEFVVFDDSFIHTVICDFYSSSTSAPIGIIYYPYTLIRGVPLLHTIHTYVTIMLFSSISIVSTTSPKNKIIYLDFSNHQPSIELI